MGEDEGSRQTSQLLRIHLGEPLRKLEERIKWEIVISLDGGLILNYDVPPRNESTGTRSPRPYSRGVNVREELQEMQEEVTAGTEGSV